MPGHGLAWYVFRVAANRERIVRAAFGRHDVKTFLPAYSETMRWSDRLKVIERLLFPGYLFARVKAAEIPFLLSIAGVIVLLNSNLRPAPIPDSEIQNVERVISSLLSVEPAYYAPGEQVTIKTGPLKGVSGTVLRHGAKTRLVVSVAMLNRAVSVELDAADLAKAKAN